MLRRGAQETSAEQAAQELVADDVATKPTGSPATIKTKKGKHKKVSSRRCTTWQPSARCRIETPGTVDEGAHNESILPKGYESVLTKGYESIPWMVTSPALQAAGYIWFTMANSKYGTMGCACALSV